MKRVLVTGASGFVGRHCLPILVTRDFEVHGTFRTTQPPAIDGVSWHFADLLNDPQLVELVALLRPTHLLHLAWTTGHGKYWTAVENLDWTGATLSLLQAFTRSGGRRGLLGGTCAEYDWRHGYCVEDLTPLAPASLYGTAKHAVQLLASAFAAQQGLSLAWARLFFPYGPHEHPGRLVPSVIQALLRGEPARCTRGTQVRDFLFVEDVAAALVQVLDSEFQGVINIASGTPVAVKDVALQIGELLGRQDLIELGGVSDRPHEPSLVLADVRRLVGELSWAPRYTLVDGLKETIQWWRARLG